MELFEHQNSMFPTSYPEILQCIRNVDPVKYGSTRNYINGSVTYLSPYISRGVISTNFILSEILNRGYKPSQIEKFIQELAWRDYWQLLWLENDINTDLKRLQPDTNNNKISLNITKANSGIEIIDSVINGLYETGYIHNHLRMYLVQI